MAEIHARRGALAAGARHLPATAEIYIEQGFLRKAITVYKSVLKLTPGLPHVRERAGRDLPAAGDGGGRAARAGAGGDELQQSGRPAEALPALRKIVGLHPDNVVVAHPAGGDGVAGRARPTRRSTSSAQLAMQLKAQGRADEYVRVAERLLFHRPDDFAVARELAAAYIAAQATRGWRWPSCRRALKAAPRDPQNVTLLAEALAQLDPRKAMSVWRELAEIHDAAGRLSDRDAAVRAALALDPHRRGDARDGGALGRRGRRGVGRAGRRPPPLPVGRCSSGARRAAARRGRVGRRDRSGTGLGGWPAMGMPGCFAG